MTGDTTLPALQDPLLVVGCQRSGTTLLRTILNAHSGLAVGYECDFFQALAGTYGQTRDIREHLDRFLADLMAVTRFEFWEIAPEDIRAVFGTMQAPVGFADAIRLVCEAYRRKHKPGAVRCGVKNPNSIEHLAAYWTLFPRGQVVHIIRDPRAVLASEKKKLTRRDGRFNSLLNTIRVARRWNKAVRAQARAGADSRLLVLRYHDLVTGTEDSLRALCAGLELPFDPQMLDYYKGTDTPRQELWQHALTKAPPSPERLSAYLGELTGTEIACINFLCRAHLGQYSDGRRTGYRLMAVLPSLALGGVQWALAGVPRKLAHLLRESLRKKAA
ncbi:sulfotransferase family protein [Leisingera thetidis]|uniref:sulfotransferase family protein n=1 Tax=Leisingera thetidis TaxID=2930199 RepID=UPI0021F6B906|nr:sulfotransferase [Leisingera thetidis]